MTKRQNGAEDKIFAPFLCLLSRFIPVAFFSLFFLLIPWRQW
jgi:hypothetical protein